MYEERKEKFSFKSFFLTLLLVLLFVFLMLWLFPTKSYVDEKLQSTYDLERLEVLYDEIFANNVARMKDAAIGYFTNERMPKTVGESKKLTLGQMYDLHLVLKMKDKDGKPCDTEKSYVEMTKYTEEYRLKVNLSCGNQEDYIIVYLGCYNYCSDGICEKRVPTPAPTTPKEPEKKPEQKPENPIAKKYLYEYKLVVKDSKTCANWTEWSKTKVTASDLVKVETKTQEEVVAYKTVKVPVTTTEVVTKKVTERYVSKYITELVKTGTKDIQIGTTTKTVTEEVKVGTVEVRTGKIGKGTLKEIPKKTSTTTYEIISEDTPPNCSYCENETIYTWEIIEIKPVYEVREVTKTVPVYKTINVYETKEIPVYDFRTVEKKEKVEKTTYVDKKVEQYGKVTYYRSQTCKINKGYTDIKWSNTKLDIGLIGKGYKLTGNVKEA